MLLSLAAVSRMQRLSHVSVNASLAETTELTKSNTRRAAGAYRFCFSHLHLTLSASSRSWNLGDKPRVCGHRTDSLDVSNGNLWRIWRSRHLIPEPEVVLERVSELQP